MILSLCWVAAPPRWPTVNNDMQARTRKRHSKTPKRRSPHVARLVDQYLKDIRTLLGYKSHPRNGKIARLPHATRTLINQMLDDGVPYKAILARLLALSPQLSALNLSEMNLSNWRYGGYQDWGRHQAAMAFAEAGRRAVASHSSQTRPASPQTHLTAPAKAEIQVAQSPSIPLKDLHSP